MLGGPKWELLAWAITNGGVLRYLLAGQVTAALPSEVSDALMVTASIKAVVNNRNRLLVSDCICSSLTYLPELRTKTFYTLSVVSGARAQRAQ